MNRAKRELLRLDFWPSAWYNGAAVNRAEEAHPWMKLPPRPAGPASWESSWATALRSPKRAPRNAR
jgi:hypothetical protein